ncbi:Solute carrier family 49 member 4 [Varanus komodoensis]|nr:Solute carrier family 49 member 4 [Varanus komodoensis]
MDSSLRACVYTVMCGASILEQQQELSGLCVLLRYCSYPRSASQCFKTDLEGNAGGFSGERESILSVTSFLIGMKSSGLIHGGQLLNGLAGPTFSSAAPFLSTTWFSPDERATATAVASLIGYLGGACAFLVGPLLVPGPNSTSTIPLAPGSSSEHIKDRIEAVLYAGIREVIAYYVLKCEFVMYLLLPSSDSSGNMY